MPPRWNRAQERISWAINTGLGAESFKIIIPPDSSYDFGDGEQTSGTGSEYTVTLALESTNKNDFDYIPEGFRERIIYKIYTDFKLDRSMMLENDSCRYEIIVPSIKLPAGNFIIAYRTYIARVENQVEG